MLDVVKTEINKQSLAQHVARRAVHRLEEALSTALDVCRGNRTLAFTYIQTDWRVQDAVLALAALGLDQTACPTAAVSCRLTAVEFDTILLNHVGRTLLGIAKEHTHG